VLFHILLIINSGLLFIFTCILSYLSVKGVASRQFLKNTGDTEGITVIEKLYKKRHADIKTGLGIFKNYQARLIEKSNIRRFIPFFSPQLLLCIKAFIALVIAGPVYNMTMFLPSTVIICFLFSLLPDILLDLVARYNSVVIRRSLAEYVAVLNRWCQVREDIFYAFEKSLQSGAVSEPLKTFIRDMLIQVKNGIAPEFALSLLQNKVDNPQFNDFIVNIRYCVINRGDIRRLLSNLEDQFYKIEEEYNRRKISTYRDRIVIYIVMFAIIVIAYFFLKLNPEIEQFYFQTLNGRMLLTVFCILYAAGFYVTCGITKYRY